MTDFDGFYALIYEEGFGSGNGDLAATADTERDARRIAADMVGQSGRHDRIGIYELTRIGDTDE